MEGLRGKTVCATGVHAPARGRVEGFEVALIEIDATGAITAALRSGTADCAAGQAAQRAGRLVTLPPGSYLLSGFIDLHVNAP